MKYLYRFIVLILLFPHNANAQKLTGQSIESFIAQDGWAKIKQLKNGNTFLIEISNDGAMVITVFDSTHKNVAQNNVRFTAINKDLSKVALIECFEWNGKVILFFNERIKKSPTLFMAIFDGWNGVLLEDKIVLEIPPEPFGSKFAHDFGNMSYPYFDLEFDPYTGFYAVLLFNPFTETNSRIQVVHYNPNHEIINQSFYIVPEESFKYVDAVNLYVKGGEYLLLTTHLYNTKASGGRKSKIYLSKFENGKTKFLNRSFPINGFFKNVSGSFQYNKASQKLHLYMSLLYEKEGGYSYYSLFTQVIDADNLEFMEATTIPMKAAQDLYVKTLRKKDQVFTGMPQYYGLDGEGNNFFLFQKTTLHISGGIGGSITTSLGDITLSNFDKNGVQKYADVIRCNYSILGDHSSLTYNSKVYNPSQSLYVGNLPDPSYFHIDVVASKKYTYLFMNNRTDNILLPENKKPKLTKSTSNLSMVRYKYSSAGLIEKIVVDKGDSLTDEKKYFNPTASDFDEASGKYVTLVLKETYESESTDPPMHGAQETTGFTKKVIGELIWFDLE